MKADGAFTPIFRDAAEWQRLLTVLDGWIGTPYLDGGRWCGRGSDCIAWIACIFHELGLIPKPRWRPYPKGWFKQATAENLLLNAISQHLVGLKEKGIRWLMVMPQEGLERGDVLLTRTGRAPIANHALLHLGGKPGDEMVAQCGTNTGVRRMSYHRWARYIKYGFRVHKWASHYSQ